MICDGSLSLGEDSMFTTMLSAVQLRAIADKLDALRDTNVDVREFVMGSLTISVTQKDDGHEQVYYVTRLRSGSGFNVRSVMEPMKEDSRS